MPALPPASRTLKIQYKFGIGEDLGALCREYVQYPGVGPSNSDAATIAANINDSFSTHLAGLMDVSRTLVEVEVMDLSSPTGAVGTNSTPVPGTRTGAQLPASTSLLLSREVARRYRGGHSRTYWPFGVQGDLTDPQTWAIAFRNAATTGFADHFTAWNAANPPSVGSTTRVNVSYYQGFTVHTGTTGRAKNVSTPRPSPIIDIIVGEIVRAGVAQVRKRLLGLA